MTDYPAISGITDPANVRVALIQGKQIVHTPLAGLFPTGSWTPSLTFATPGDLAVAYTWQIGEYFRFGNVVMLFFTILTSGFTHTTASGGIRITGVPLTAKTLTNMRWNGALGQVQGVTKVNYTQFMAGINSAGTFLTVTASGSGQATGPVNAADMPTGGTITLAGSVIYSV